MEDNDDDDENKKKLELMKMFDLLPSEDGFDVPTVVTPPHQDFDIARQNMMKAIMQAQNLLGTFHEVCSSTTNPRAMEVWTELFEKFMNANKDLLALQKQQQELLSKSNVPDARAGNIEGDLIQNNLIVGTTADINKLLNELANKKNKDYAEEQTRPDSGGTT
jgi:hypothetical protein